MTPLVNYAKIFDDLAQEISETSEGKGFWPEEVSEPWMIPIKIALVYTELSEALEAHRKLYDDDTASDYSGMTPMQEDDFQEELADAVIRILDIVGYYGLDDFGLTIIEKMDRNRTRPPKHGKRY